MGFKSSLLAAFTTAIIGVCFLWASYADDPINHNLNNPKGVQVTADICREALHRALSEAPSIKGWPPTAQFRVDIEDMTTLGKDAPSVRLKVNARAIAYAYYDTESGDSARLTAALGLLTKENWTEIVSGVVCASPYDEKSFGTGNIHRIAWVLNYFFSVSKFTLSLYKFKDQFNLHFNNEDMRLGRKFMRGEKILSHEIAFSETYTDSNFVELSIFTDSYALMWNPKEETQPEVVEKLLEGIMDPKKSFRFSTIIKMAGKTEEEINGEIDMAAKKAADAVLNYLKAVSGQLEI